MQLAMACGTTDYRAIADSLSDARLIDWVAFGVLEGWFHAMATEQSKMLSPEEALRKLTNGQ